MEFKICLVECHHKLDKACSYSGIEGTRTVFHRFFLVNPF